MNEQTHNEVIEKLQKVLNLANGLNATQGEMEAAMGRAKEIALRYNIDLASVELNKDNGKTGAGLKVEKHTLKIRSKHEQKYHRWIYNALQACFGVKVIRTHGGTVYFIGATVDVLICSQLFPWLEQVFYQTYWRAKKAGVVVSCAADKNGIYYGLYLGIVEVNSREEEKLTQTEKSCVALVLRRKEDLIKAKVKEEFPFLRKVKQSQFTTNTGAMDHGRQEGRKINLRQTGSGTPQGRLE